MKVKEESEKAVLKLNVQKTKIMASGPITSWQIDGETVEIVADFILKDSKIIADGDCSYERQILLACVWSACSVWTTLGLPPLKAAVCASWVYIAQSPGFSAGSLSKAGPAFHALPTSESLRFSGTPQGHRLCWVCVFVPLPGPSSSGDQVFGEYTVPGGLCILITPQSWPLGFPVVPCVSSGELISGCSPPGRCQPSRIPGKCG